MPDEQTLTPEDFARLQDQHQTFISGFNEFDPASPLYRRPDLVARYRADAEAKHQAFLARAGYSPDGNRLPASAPPADVDIIQRSEKWLSQLDERIAALPAATLDREGHARTVQELKDTLAAERFEQLNGSQLTRPTEAGWHRREGETQYAELIRLAKIIRPNLPDSIVNDPPTLKALAGLGRYKEAQTGSPSPTNPARRFGSV